MEGPDPRISVVLLTHNRCDEVLRTLGHLAALPEKPQIVVVDNGSTDGTASILARRYPHIELVETGRNLGAAGRTLGLQRAKTPYVALCDDDTWWEPGSLAKAADLFDTHARLAIVTGQVLVGPENRLDPICTELDQSPLPDDDELPGRPLLGFLAGASVVRRSAILDAGGFEPRFFIGGEEELLAADLAAKGWAIRYIPQLTVHHHPSLQRDGVSRRWALTRNALWFAWLRRPWPSALRRTVELARSSPPNWTTFRGFAAAVRGLPWVLRERQVVPAEVEHGLRLLDARRTAAAPHAH
jgi:GT2 family glycosyltransferase